MDSTKVNELIKSSLSIFISPSVVLSVVSSGGSLGTISDTRKQAGANQQVIHHLRVKEQHKNQDNNG